LSDRPLRGAKQPVDEGWRRSAAGQQETVEKASESGHWSGLGVCYRPSLRTGAFHDSCPQ